MDDALAGIPLHELPDTLVTPTMIFGGIVRQFREKTEQVLGAFGKMDENDFDDFFKSLEEMNQSFDQTCSDVEAILVELNSNA